jgi:hypothetical protein
VIYRQRTYPVSNLERGDYVAARVQQDRDGRCQCRKSIGSHRRPRREHRYPPRHLRDSRST